MDPTHWLPAKTRRISYNSVISLRYHLKYICDVMLIYSLTAMIMVVVLDSIPSCHMKNIGYFKVPDSKKKKFQAKEC